mgnify:CR=1 FL=1
MNLQHMDYRRLIVCLMCHKRCINGVQDKNYLRVVDMAKEANFVFLAIFSSGRPFFSVIFPGVQAVLLCRVPGPCFSRHVPWRQPCSLGWQEAQPCTERLLMNCAPCITRLFSGHLSRTGEGGFRHRISIPYRKSLFFTPNASENASRTPGACFFARHAYSVP